MQESLVSPPQESVTQEPKSVTQEPQTAAEESQSVAEANGGGKEGKVFRVAGELFRRKPDWVTFFREVLGVDGIVRRLFPTKEQLTAFEHTEEYDKIQHMIAKLRARDRIDPELKEPTRVITVRMPLSLHATLQTESHEKATSINKLCISKLLQVIDDELIPRQAGNRRGLHSRRNVRYRS